MTETRYSERLSKKVAKDKLVAGKDFIEDMFDALGTEDPNWNHKKVKALVEQSKINDNLLEGMKGFLLGFGEQVALLWPNILSDEIEIGFAAQSFRWTNNAKGNAKRIIIAGLIPFVCDAVKIHKLTHLSAHTTSELPACSKQAQNTAHNTAKIKIEPILLAAAG